MGDNPDLAVAPLTAEAPAGSLLSLSLSQLSPAARKVMDAGVELFSETGFLATTIRDLTRSCGLTAPAFYNHFESKGTLLYEIIIATNAELDRLLDAMPVTESPAETLTELMRTMATFNLTYPKETRSGNRE